eukprot:8999235-Prorocentrum_lima.AAC.1
MPVPLAAKLALHVQLLDELLQVEIIGLAEHGRQHLYHEAGLCASAVVGGLGLIALSELLVQASASA